MTDAPDKAGKPAAESPPPQPHSRRWLVEGAVVIDYPADRAVHWMQPTDSDKTMFVSLRDASGLPHGEGVNVAFADGTIRIVSRDTSNASRRAMVTILAGDDPG